MGVVLLDDAIDDLDGLIAELTDLRQQLCRAELSGHPEDALWEVESGLHRVADRSESRARTVRRAIELLRVRRAG